MKVNKRILIIGVLLGLITVFFLNRYISTLNQVEEAAANSFVDVVVATKSIPEHVKITEDMITIASIPEDAVHPDSIKTLDKVVGGISRSEIINGEQILSGRVVTEDVKATLSYQIPDNMRAITIPVNEVSGVANYIDVGDKVDILVSYEMEVIQPNGQEKAIPYTYTQLQNIEVLALGGLKAPIVEGTPEELEQTTTITILVNPKQAEVVAFANINGQFHLTLRNPADVDINELQFYSTVNFQTYKER
ncbi:Flp pilus assembly protein CpaB [Tissierella creatinini]|nr:Flp pilus assembly protein CpaB [Tissierella creatinini]TJX61511.1 Flp pilus assembly protein CpaB [Soehngenia saccharolytica]